MVYEKGNYRFPSRAYFDMLLEAHILAEYDLSPKLREAHDRLMREKTEKKKDE